MSVTPLPLSVEGLRQQLDVELRRGPAAGLQYLVMHEGRVCYEHAAGQADVAASRPVTPETVFNLYSITKPFTAALVLGLAQRGMLDLQAPIAQATGLAHLQRLGTVRSTLLHRAGFANPMPLRWIHRAADDPAFDEVAFASQVLAAPGLGRPRSPRYSNLGYLALGRAVERRLGMPFRQAMELHVLQPLALQPGEALGFGAASPADWARGHLRRFGLLNLALGGWVHRADVVAGRWGPWVSLHHHHVDGSAYGGLIGNARGLARFGLAMLGLSPGLEAPLRTALGADVPGPGPSRSQGWFTGRLHGQRWLGHAGGGLGAYAELRVYPEAGALSVLLTNRPGLRDVRALDTLDAHWLPAKGKG